MAPPIRSLPLPPTQACEGCETAPLGGRSAPGSPFLPILHYCCDAVKSRLLWVRYKQLPPRSAARPGGRAAVRPLAAVALLAQRPERAKTARKWPAPQTASSCAAARHAAHAAVAAAAASLQPWCLSLSHCCLITYRPQVRFIRAEFASNHHTKRAPQLGSAPLVRPFWRKHRQCFAPS